MDDFKKGDLVRFRYAMDKPWRGIVLEKSKGRDAYLVRWLDQSGSSVVHSSHLVKMEVRGE